MRQTQVARYGARSFIVHGDGDDPYFAGLDLERDHGFLKQVLARTLPEDGVAIDVGANIGLATLLMAERAPRGRVLAYEPDPRAHEWLAATIAENGLTQCEAHCLALGDAPGELPFFANPRSATANHLAPPEASLQGATGQVPVRMLDELAAGLDRLDLLKIDVEGFEMEVLEGARATLRRLRPATLVEFNGYTLLAFADRNPRHVLEALLDRFAEVHCDMGHGLQRIDGRRGMMDFLHFCIVHRQFVDDLLCLNPR
jgi:FkbM family methyltransferase